MTPEQRKLFRWITAGIIVLLVVVVVWAVVAVRADTPVTYADIREHFK